MALHKIILLYEGVVSELGEHIAHCFDAKSVAAVEQVFELLKKDKYKALVFDCIKSEGFNLETCRKLLQGASKIAVPVVVMTQRYELQDKLKAYDIGVDDIIDLSVANDEACARITKSIFNQIAQEQLQSRLEQASLTAHSAMSDNSDLGANIQFLLAVHDTDNLDQLGQQLFSTLRRYGLHCSLQMRSILGDKNMEAHGMAKDLESQLLTQLADSGRFIDFGSRTIINFDRVSLLIKNMPLKNGEKYGAIKDNVFTLMQGVNARIIALEDKHRLLKEKDTLRKLSFDVGVVMNSIKDSYQQVMCEIVNEVENVAELIQMKVPALALTEAQEEFLENATNRAIVETNRIFNDGLVVDEVFAKLEAAIDNSLRNVEPAQKQEAVVVPGSQADGEDNTVELF